MFLKQIHQGNADQDSPVLFVLSKMAFLGVFSYHNEVQGPVSI